MTDSQESAGESFNMETALRRAQEELRRVEQVVSELTGLPSNWNGNVELRVDAAWRGAKPFRCDIFLDAARQAQEARWRTHLHEMLHAHSAGYTRYAFDAFPGWEEGVVEKLQRLLRPQMLARLSLAIPASVFETEEVAHEFNPYIAALDDLFQLVQRLGENETDFYIALLATPLRDRMGWVMGRGSTLPTAERAAFLRAFGQASVILRNPPRS